jgi:hypothetical protein
MHIGKHFSFLSSASLIRIQTVFLSFIAHRDIRIHAIRLLLLLLIFQTVTTTLKGMTVTSNLSLIVFLGGSSYIITITSRTIEIEKNNKKHLYRFLFFFFFVFLLFLDNIQKIENSFVLMDIFTYLKNFSSDTKKTLTHCIVCL